MSAQMSLLTDTPRARRSDPVTSHRAAERIKGIGALAQQQHLVLAWVREHPGLTSAELAQLMARRQDGDPALWSKYRPMIARRLGELVPAHLKRGPQRRCLVTGSPSITWWVR